MSDNYPGKNELWWVKITDRRDKDGVSLSDGAMDVTIRFGQDEWIGDMGRNGDLEAIERAIDIVGLHNAHVIQKADK